MISNACTRLFERQAPSVMNTSVNSDTWTSVGIKMPITANDDPLETMIAASAIAIMNNSVPSAAEVVAASMAQTISVLHIARPNHEALSISAATTAIAASA